MAHSLRDYQIDAIAKVRESLSKNRRVILQMPTGAGKTATAAAIIQSALGKGKRVIFTVPSLSLITQTIESFQRDGITDIGVMQGQHILTDADASVQICSVQTLARRFIPWADLVIVDEAHVVFDLYKRWLNNSDWAKVPFIGLSATPWAAGLGKLWGGLVIGATIQQLIDDKYLCDFRCFAPTKPDLEGVKTVAGDYEITGLEKAMNQKKITAEIVSTWIEKGEGRPTLCFAVNRAHAAAICDEFNAAGVPAAYVDGEYGLDDRDDLVQAFRNGDFKVVCNVGVMTTGVDLPFVSALIIARPTKSEMLYVQIVGRGLRTFEGKTDCLILDHSDTTARLGFVTDIIYDELDDGKRYKAKRREREDNQPLPKECPSCSYLRPPRIKTCPNCGFTPQPKIGVFTEDGELTEITGRGANKKQKGKVDLTTAEREMFYRELLGFAEERNFKQGWAYHNYKRRFGIGPANTFSKTPVYASDKTRRWLKHQWIKDRAIKEKLGLR